MYRLCHTCNRNINDKDKRKEREGYTKRQTDIDTFFASVTTDPVCFVLLSGSCLTQPLDNFTKWHDKKYVKVLTFLQNVLNWRHSRLLEDQSGGLFFTDWFKWRSNFVLQEFFGIIHVVMILQLQFLAKGMAWSVCEQITNFLSHSKERYVNNS